MQYSDYSAPAANCLPPRPLLVGAPSAWKCRQGWAVPGLLQVAKRTTDLLGGMYRSDEII